jgi:hypothetical protein
LPSGCLYGLGPPAPVVDCDGDGDGDGDTGIAVAPDDERLPRRDRVDRDVDVDESIDDVRETSDDVAGDRETETDDRVCE